MRVRFTKTDSRRYSVSIDREHGPPLLPRTGPGNDDLLPHDIGHWVVEEHFGLSLGVWGQLAAGGGGIFWPAPEDNTGRHKQLVRRLQAVGRADMGRSEQLTAVVVHAWELSIGRVKHQARPFDVGLSPDELRAAVARMDATSQRWQALKRGSSMTCTWPVQLTVDPSGSRLGRRTTRESERLARR